MYAHLALTLARYIQLNFSFVGKNKRMRAVTHPSDAMFALLWAVNVFDPKTLAQLPCQARICALIGDSIIYKGPGVFGFEMDTFIGFSLLLLQQGSIMTFLAVPCFIQKCTKSFLSICTCSQYALYYIYIYIYEFSRRFYPKRLTVPFRIYIFLSVHVFSGNRTHNLCAANAML